MSIFSVRPSSLSLRRLSRSVFSLDPEYEYDLIVFCSVIGIALPQIDRCCVEEAMECFILSGTHASLSEGFNLIKARC
ncbi:hypothetical protein F2Q69_00018838 [Brassica cretica]|uniref:Uncharacterized protein n=1 Tax=Brassica cretica TaxID=69181 RepID=A0A8S9Q075_BRACR|nr:hypothetical protein F2Q69_00018838 [Brassica cretica]